MKSIPFDHYQRYNHAAEVLEIWKKETGTRNIKILEVGANEHKNLELFLEDDRITYLDIQVPEHLKSDSAYVEGDATQMPFNDHEYDWVIALDVFEHINNERKESFISELNRVGKYGFIMSAPFNTPGVSKVERNVSTFYEVLYGEKYRWLEEHEELGLPDLEKTYYYFEKENIPFLHFGHGSLAIWEKMMSIHFLVAGKFALRPYCSLIDNLYNKNIYDKDYLDPQYRQFFVSVKDRSTMSFMANWIEDRKKREIDQTAIIEINEHFGKLKILHQNISNQDRDNHYNELYNSMLSRVNQIQLINKEAIETKEIVQINNDKIMNELSNIVFKLEEFSYKLESVENTISYIRNEKIEIELKNANEVQKSLERIIDDQSEVHQKSLEEFGEIIEQKDKYISELELMAESLRLKNRIKKIVPNSLKAPSKQMYMTLKIIKNNPHYISRGLFELRRRGLKGLREKIEAMRLQQEQQPSYRNEILEQYNRNEMINDINEWTYKPLVSILMPVYNVSPKWLSMAVSSVQNQIYYNWQLVIVDDCSTNQETKDFLQNLNDPKIKITFSDVNCGIAITTNKASKEASGEYYCLLDHDDELRPNALYEMVKTLQKHKYDLLYSDEDKIDMQGVRKNPLYKPDWSPDLLRCQMYMGHLIMFKKSLFELIGGYSLGYDGAQDYDLVLRMTETPGCSIHHVPKVLYSWRELETSTALNPNSKPHAQTSGLKALNNHLKRAYGEGNAWAEETEHLFVYDMRCRLPVPNPKVSIIIPTKDKIDLLEPCVQSILHVTDYSDYEIIILDNNSEFQSTKDWFENIQAKYSFIKVVQANYDFNWSKLNNHGISVSTGDIFVFLNNDTVILTPDWLSRFAEKTIQRGVGTVGALLLYDDGTIQHAGVVIGMGGWADHIFKGMNPIHYGSPYISPAVVRNVSASTGACLAISRRTINQIGNFDENFIICGSDVEISIRATKAGLYNIYDPKIKLYHYESKTRSSFVPEQDFKMSALHYDPYLKNGDPFFNQNLSLNHVIPTIRGRND